MHAAAAAAAAVVVHMSMQLLDLNSERPLNNSAPSSSLPKAGLSGVRAVVFIFLTLTWIMVMAGIVHICRDRAGGGGGEPAEGGGDGVREPEQDPQGAPPGGAPRRAMVAAQRAAQRLRHHHPHVQQLLRLLLKHQFQSYLC